MTNLYRIGTIAPSRGDSVESELNRAKVPYLYPKLAVEVRVGRQRIREIRYRPVLAGLMFVADDYASRASEAISSAGLGISWMRNYSRLEEPARCVDVEIWPLLQWVQRQNRIVFGTEVSGPEPEPEVVLETKPVNSSVVVLEGPFKGVRAQVVEDDGVSAKVVLDGGCFSVKIRSCSIDLVPAMV